jgi:hypothetical protein
MQPQTIVLAVMFLLILSISSSFAATTLNGPSDKGIYSQTTIFSCVTTVANPTSASLQYSLGNTYEKTELITTTNFLSERIEFWESSVDITSLEDSKDYRFWCVVNGPSGTEESLPVSGMVIDNNAPLCDPTVSYGNITEFSCSCDDGLDKKLVVQRSLERKDGTFINIAGDSYSLKSEELDSLGIEKFKCTAEDSAGNEFSKSVKVDAQNPEGLEEGEKGEKNDDKVWIWLVLGGGVFFIIVAGTIATFWKAEN